MSIRLVFEFNKKYNLPNGEADYLMYHTRVQEYRLNFLQEELNELEDAFTIDDRVAAFDALLDLVYVAYGTALFMGLTSDQWEKGMLAVHNANMKKVRVNHPEQSKRKSGFDLIKPGSWTGPEKELREILNVEKET